MCGKSAIITAHAMITVERRSRFVEARHTLDRHLKSGDALADELYQRLENALKRLGNALDLSPLAHLFSERDARQCIEFLTHTQRILECRDAAERVTQAGWDQVCERLIAPPRSSRSPMNFILGWIGLRRH
jgi:hypothetical protein